MEYLLIRHGQDVELEMTSTIHLSTYNELWNGHEWVSFDPHNEADNAAILNAAKLSPSNFRFREHD